MIQYSMLLQDQRDALTQEGVKKSDFNNAIPLLSYPKELWRTPFCPLNLMFYADRFGDFMGANTKTAKICLAIYNSLDAADQHKVLTYIMEMDD